MLRNKYLAEYLKWHTKNGKFYQGFETDIQLFHQQNYLKWFFIMSGVTFAGIVVNPNYTSRSSFYLRKMTPIIFGSIGYQWGYKNQSNHLALTMMKMNDYLPLEVRRTFESKDYRHMACFDYKSLGPQNLFDPLTGKSLS